MSLLFPQPPEEAPREPAVTTPLLRPATRRWLRRGAATVAVALAAWGALIAVLNAPPVRDRLLARARAAVQARTALVTVGEELSVDALGRIRIGPVSVRGAPQGQPFLEIAALRIRPSYRALLRGRAHPASITAESPVLRMGDRGKAARAFLSSLDQRPSPRPTASASPAPSTAPAEPLVLTLFAEELRILGGPKDARELAGPLDASLTLRRDAASIGGRGRVSFTDGGLVRFAGRRDGGRFQATVELVKLGAGTLAPEQWEALPVKLNEGTLSARLTATGGTLRDPAELTFIATGERLWLEGARLAPRPVGPLSATAEATLRYEPKGRRVVLEQAGATLGEDGEVVVVASGAAAFGSRGALQLEVRMEDVRYEAILAALPRTLRPEPGSPTCRGPFDARLSVRGPLWTPEAWEVAAELKLERLDPPRSRAARLLETFEHTAVDAKGRVRNLIIGPESRSFVPLASLSETAIRTVLLSEDAGFYAHDGFEFTEIHPALLSALRGTRFRGASTLTQQLAKNLYLTREKTLSRKVKEALITIALEVSVPKDRLLEIYLNLIEWGPNLYGIGEAARHYFGVEASALRPRQIAFLATLIPNPNRYYVYFQKGALTPHWEERVRTLLTRVRDAGYLDEPGYQAALSAPIRFHRPDGASE